MFGVAVFSYPVGVQIFPNRLEVYAIHMVCIH